MSAHDLSTEGCGEKQTRATTLCFHNQLVISMDFILDLSLRRKAASHKCLESRKTSGLTGVQPWLLHRADCRGPGLPGVDRSSPLRRLPRKGDPTSHTPKHLSESCSQMSMILPATLAPKAHLESVFSFPFHTHLEQRVL